MKNKMSINVKESKLSPFSKLTTKEGLKEHKRWFTGNFFFLVERSLKKYLLKKTSMRRDLVARSIGKYLPPLTDDHLLFLTKAAVIACKAEYLKKYYYTGFAQTKSEELFYKNLNQVIREAKTKGMTPVQIDRDFLGDKLAVGPLVPDSVVFGLRYGKKNCPIVFEIDGGSHLDKVEKDQIREDVLRSIGIKVLRIRNKDAESISFVRKLITPMRSVRSGNGDKAIATQKRLLMCKTISCFLSLDEIDELIADKFDIQQYLKLEAEQIVKLKQCPRRITAELKSKESIKKYYKLLH